TATVINNTVGCSGGDVPLSLSMAVLAPSFGGAVAPNTYGCTVEDIAVRGTVAENTTLGAVSGVSVYRLDASTTVAGGTTLTVPAGVTLGSTAGYTLTVNGVFDVMGGSIENFYTTVNSTGTMTMTGGSMVTPGYTLTVNGVAEIENSSVATSIISVSAGGQLTATAMTWTGTGYVLFGNGSSGTVTDSAFMGSNGTAGLYIDDATVTVSGTLFDSWSNAVILRDNPGPGVKVLDDNTYESNTYAIRIDGAGGNATVSNSTFTNNGHSVYLLNDEALFSAFPTLFDTNTFVGTVNAPNTVHLPSTINDSGVVPVPPRPYFAAGTTVTGSVDVVLQAGTVIASSTSTNITVNAGSRLLVNGTEYFPVVFTNDLRNGTGRWRGLRINGDTSSLDNCVIEFSGFEGLLLNNASIPVTNCSIRDNLQEGIELTGDSSPVITDSALIGNLQEGLKVNLSGLPSPGPVIVNHNSIFSNGGLGINNLGTTFDVDGTLNYWGDDSGPLDDSDDTATGGLFNPTGAGQSVSDHVLYDPWIIVGPSQAGVIVPVSGGGQVGMPGAMLPDPLVVRIDSVLGSPLENIEVIFSVVSGDASIVEPQPVLTAASGEAQATVQLGITPGEVLLAVTARDVNSPLATFIGEVDGASLMSLTTVPLALPVVRDRPGDVDGNGVVNNRDAALLQAVLDGRISAGSWLVPNYHRGADINRDHVVDSGDVLVIQGVQVGLIRPQVKGESL
ncbi:MAG: hypothetical protein HKN70_13280, partial [Gammaproteobacteria bacterium]|nr:hypothetical protein [Gammaproteobacteria bacterium]